MSRYKVYGESMWEFIQKWMGAQKTAGVVLTEEERMGAYLKACAGMTEASAATKRKWRRALGLKAQ